MDYFDNCPGAVFAVTDGVEALYIDQQTFPAVDAVEISEAEVRFSLRE